MFINFLTPLYQITECYIARQSQESITWLNILNYDWLNEARKVIMHFLAISSLSLTIASFSVVTLERENVDSHECEIARKSHLFKLNKTRSILAERRKSSYTLRTYQYEHLPKIGFIMRIFLHK